MAEYNWEDPREIVVALITLFEMQTRDEQVKGITVYQNSVGFNSVDSGILTSISQQIIERGFVTDKQLNLVRITILKYSKQLSSLERSCNSAIDSVRIVLKKEKADGKLYTDGKHLFFLPMVYPSTQIKSIGNFFWRGTEVGWEGPLNKPQMDAVSIMFPKLEIDSSIDNWVIAQDIPVELSKTFIESVLFPGQKRTTAGLLKCKRGMAALRPGLGKSASAIFAGNELDPVEYDSILVVCPLTLVNNWKNEIKKWIGAEAVIWHGKPDLWESYYRWVITNYETVSRNLEAMIKQGFKVIILDETILIKNRKAVRTEAVKSLTRNTEYLWLLSGSPTSHFLDDMWSQLNIIDSRRFSSYWKFVDQYCVRQISQWGTTVGGNQNDSNERILRDLSDIYFTADESEFPSIPEWIFDTVEIPMGKEQYKLYQEMEDSFIAELPDGNEVLALNVLSQLLRLIQFASNPLLLDGPDDSNKWKAVEDMMEYEVGPFIVWTNFKRTAELMAQRLSKKYRVGVLTGDTPALERQSIVDSMQNGNLDVIVAHPAVGKFGLTLTKARTAIYMERSYNGDDYYQSLYRIRRISTVTPPHVILLISSKPDGSSMTIDHTIDRILQYRKDNSIAITSKLISETLGKPNDRR